LSVFAMGEGRPFLGEFNGFYGENSRESTFRAPLRQRLHRAVALPCFAG
jgi:hypothetical protein